MEEKKNPIYKKWWFWVIIIVIVVVITGGSGNNSNTAVSSQGTGTGEATNQEKTDKTVKVGEVVTTDEVKISYKSCKEYTKYNSYSKPKSGKKVMRMEFEFENVSNGDIYLDGFECYADGEKCEEYYFADDYKNSILVSLSKGKKVKAVLYYEVPKIAKEIVLEYETDYWSEEKVEFIVK